MPYNLASPNGLIEPPDAENPLAWYLRETEQVANATVRNVIQEVGNNIENFVRWPKHALLLWTGCHRIPEVRGKQKYHRYPESIKSLARKSSVYLDTRPNGPAIASFSLAQGERPDRFGSSNKWSIHHVYSGKFPYPGRESTTHASKLAFHFTQSAGLVAVHPIADSLADEFPFFTWLLRLDAFVRFKYDPDGVFSPAQDELGFSDGHSCKVIEVEV